MKNIPISKPKYTNPKPKIQVILGAFLYSVLFMGYISNSLHATQLNGVRSASQAGEDFAEFLLNKQQEDIQEEKATLPFSKKEEITDKTSKSAKSFLQRTEQPLLLVFVSFSMPKKALENLAKEVKRAGGILVLRGLKENSFKRTASALLPLIEKTGQGALIDPLLFRQFDIQRVPSFVLTRYQKCLPHQSCLPQKFDKVTGHVSVRYALEEMAKNGDLKEEAKIFLKKLKEEA